MTLIQPKLLVVIFKKKVKVELMTKRERKSESLWKTPISWEVAGNSPSTQIAFCHFQKESEIDDKK